MIYYAASVAIGLGNASSWNDCDSLVNIVNSYPLVPGDEIWALGNNNVIGPSALGTYNLVGNTLVINVQNLSMYGGCRGNEPTPPRTANIVSTQYPTFFQFSSILDGGNANRVIEISANGCRVDGFVIKNGYAGTGTQLDGGGIHVLSSNIWLENLVIMENTAGRSGGGLCFSQSGGQLKNIIFFKNRAISGGGGGFYLDRTHDVVSQNVLFNDNSVDADSTMNGNAIYIYRSNRPLFINNTIADNLHSSAVSVYCDNATTSNIDFRNSILYPDTLAATGGNVLVEYCCLGTIPIGIPLANIINSLPIPTNPLFVNPVPLSTPNANYRLQAGSPCIDAGNNAFVPPSVITTDLEGNNRINGPNVDMGAFEM